MSSIKRIVEFGRIQATVPVWWAALEMRGTKASRCAPHLRKSLCSETQGRSCSGLRNHCRYSLPSAWLCTSQRRLSTFRLTLQEKVTGLFPSFSVEMVDEINFLGWLAYDSLCICNFSTVGPCFNSAGMGSADTLPAWAGLVHSMGLHRF